jgi:hypothetical protein
MNDKNKFIQDFNAGLICEYFSGIKRFPDKELDLIWSDLCSAGFCTGKISGKTCR